MSYYISKKKVKGKTYYYALRNEWTPKGSRVVEQIYLGTADKVVEALGGKGQPAVLKTYEFGRPAAMLSAICDLGLAHIINSCVDKNSGFSAEEIALLVPIGRFQHRTSKLDIAQWYADSYLAHRFDAPKALSEENIYRLMDRLDEGAQGRICGLIAKRLSELGLAPSSLIFDTSNFATQIEHGEELPRKGKSKEGKHEDNLVGVAAAVTDENIPFLWETYCGSTNDARMFPSVVKRLVERLKTLPRGTEGVTLIFDRGNNSAANIKLAASDLHVIGGLKRNQAPELYDVPLEKFEYLYASQKDNKIYGYDTEREAFGRKFRCVVVYNESSAKRQLLKFEEQKKRATEKLARIEQSLARGGKGRKLTVAGAVRKAKAALPGQLSALAKIEAENGKYSCKWLDGKEAALRKAFGKQVLFTDIRGGSAADIAKAYNRKNIIEDDFKLMRSSLIIPIAPIHHRLDRRISSHIFLCVLGVLLYRYILWKVKKLGMTEDETLDAMDKIQVSLVSAEGGSRAEWCVNRMSAPQAALFGALGMAEYLPKRA